MNQTYSAFSFRTILLLITTAVLCLGFPRASNGAPDSQAASRLYSKHRQRLNTVGQIGDIEREGPEAVDSQIFPIIMKGEGEVSFIPASDRESNRLVLFLARVDGIMAYKADQLETNNRIRGQLRQPDSRVAAVPFQDMDGDGWRDIVLITARANEGAGKQEKPYKVGDVLFRRNDGFYRGHGLSERMNRFGMNKGICLITPFVRDGYPTEFLYTATAQDELLSHRMTVISEQSRSIRFEKFGRLLVVPGTYRMAEYTVFMLYLVNEQGYIVWSFQPMGEYEHLYALKGVICQDVDGDGLKDIVILVDYSYEGNDGETVAEGSYTIYYQRIGGFFEDADMKQTPILEEGDTLSGLTDRVRAYWGWRTEP